MALGSGMVRVRGGDDGGEAVDDHIAPNLRALCGTGKVEFKRRPKIGAGCDSSLVPTCHGNAPGGGAAFLFKSWTSARFRRASEAFQGTIATAGPRWFLETRTASGPMGASRWPYGTRIS